MDWERMSWVLKKIVVFNGSPRKNGFTARLIEEVVKGAESRRAEVKIYDLNHDGIKGCQGCNYCRSHEGCAVQDYLQPMYEDIKNASGIIFGSPIYFHDITGQAKQWVDRMSPMVDAKFKPRYPGKKAVTIFAQRNENKEAFQAVIQEMNRFMSMFGWKLTDNLICSGTGSSEFRIPDELLKRAFAAGEALAGE